MSIRGILDMRKFDVNGNTVSANVPYLKQIIRSMTSGTYRTDDYGRIMVDMGDGGFIVFFKRDESAISDQVREKLTHVENWKDSSSPARHGPES